MTHKLSMIITSTTKNSTNQRIASPPEVLCDSASKRTGAQIGAPNPLAASPPRRGPIAVRSGVIEHADDTPKLHPAVCPQTRRRAFSLTPHVTVSTSMFSASDREAV